MFDWISALIGLGAGLGAGAVAFFILRSRFAARLAGLERRNTELETEAKMRAQAEGRARAELENAFRNLADRALAANSENFLKIAQERLKQQQAEGGHDLDKRRQEIEKLIDPVHKALTGMDEKIRDLEKARTDAYAELRTSVKAMMEDQTRLRGETASLVQALRSPSTRGQWGEMQLRRCLEMSGMQRGVHFDEQVSAEDIDGRHRPDVIIKLSGGKSIVIDSKAPVEAYLDALKDGLSEDERAHALSRHARHVRIHLQQLGSKAYWKHFDTPEFVVMFLPGESYFSAALEKDPSLIEAGVDLKVIPATPTTLISLLKAVMYGWRQEQLAENARQVSELGAELYERIAVFAGHMDRVGKGLNAATDNYNKAVSSLESRVLVSARKFRELHAASERAEISAASAIDAHARSLAAPEIDAEIQTESEESSPERASGGKA